MKNEGIPQGSNTCCLRASLSAFRSPLSSWESGCAAAQGEDAHREAQPYFPGARFARLDQKRRREHVPCPTRCRYSQSVGGDCLQGKSVKGRLNRPASATETKEVDPTGRRVPDALRRAEQGGKRAAPTPATKHTGCATLRASGIGNSRARWTRISLIPIGCPLPNTACHVE